MYASPFLTLWIQPRATMKRLLKREPSGWVIGLAILAGVSQSIFELFDAESAPDVALPLAILLSLMGGVVGGLIGLYLSTYLLRWTGRWLGGQDDFYAIQSAVGWSSLPTACSLLLLAPMFALLGTDILTPNWLESATPEAVYLFLGFSLAHLVLAIWAIVLLVKCLAEVQGFSAWRALANLVLSLLVVVLPILALGALLGGLKAG